MQEMLCVRSNESSHVVSYRVRLPETSACVAMCFLRSPQMLLLWRVLGPRNHTSKTGPCGISGGGANRSHDEISSN